MMSDSDLTSIPLPVEPNSARTRKKSVREMLQEALVDQKKSSNKESTTSSKHTSNKHMIISGSEIKIVESNEAGESSQSIVDELFKDFIAQKFSSASRGTTEAGDETTGSRVRNSADEISKILDMEINTIMSQTESKDVTKQQEKLIGKTDHKLNSSSKPAKYIPIGSAAKEKRKQSEHISASNCVKSISTQPEDSSVSSLKPKNNSECENIVDSVKSQSMVAPSSDTATTVGALTDSKTTVLPGAEQAKDTSQPQTSENITNIKRNVMLPAQLMKRMMPPKVLGVKLSTESLSLITSTDRIDREGRVWEEGEVPSSHSENSEKEIGESDSEPDGFPSDSGSVNSSTENWKTQSSKHKKKHKRKHKKKKKKSVKEKDDSGEKDKNKEPKDKEKKRGKDKDGHSKDKHRKHSKDDSSNENSKNTKDRESGREDEKVDIQQSKGDTEKQSREKDKSSDKEHEVARKTDKEESSKRKRSNSRSKSPKRHRKSRSRSRSRSKSPKKHRNWSSSGGRYSEWDARRYSDDARLTPRDRSRSRSRSTERSSERRRQSRDNTRSHQADRTKEGNDRDLRLRIDKAKLRKIAIANALQNMRAGQGPQVDLTLAKSGGKSVEELTEFCKRISEKSKTRSGNEVISSSDEDVTKDSDDDDMLIHHPFKMKEASSSSIVMNIRNSKQLPILTPSEKQAQQATLRLTFPVSSGSHHRASESEWVPVVKTPVNPAPAPVVPSSQVAIEAPPPPPTEKKVDNIFPQQSETQTIDIGSIISERLQAVRKLQENPFDMQALSKMHQAQEQASKWATSKHLPGQFTGSTGAQVLSQEQLIGNRKHQAWAKKVACTHHCCERRPWGRTAYHHIS